MLVRKQALLGSLGYLGGGEHQSTGAPRESFLAGYTNGKSFPHSALVSNIQGDEVKACVDNLIKIMFFLSPKASFKKCRTKPASFEISINVYCLDAQALFLKSNKDFVLVNQSVCFVFRIIWRGPRKTGMHCNNTSFFLGYLYIWGLLPFKLCQLHSKLMRESSFTRFSMRPTAFQIMSITQ